MSNETIIINQTELFLNVGGRRITALPATGVIATMERLTNRSALIEGLHNTAALVINGARGYRFTINVMPMSADDEWLFAAILAIDKFSQPLGATLTYKTTTYVSGSCTIEVEPARNYNADTTEPVGYPLIGVFQIARVGRFTNPDTLTADQIQSQIVS